MIARDAPAGPRQQTTLLSMTARWLVVTVIGCSAAQAPPRARTSSPTTVQPSPAIPFEAPPTSPHMPLDDVDLEPIATTAGTRGDSSSQREIAERDNADGNRFMTVRRFAEATAKFREAATRVPEPAYFFNLCLSSYREGKLREASTACEAVFANAPSTTLEAKTRKLISKVRDEARHQGLSLD